MADELSEDDILRLAAENFRGLSLEESIRRLLEASFRPNYDLMLRWARDEEAKQAAYTAATSAM